jgi:hypothetical protein
MDAIRMVLIAYLTSSGLGCRESAAAPHDAGSRVESASHASAQGTVRGSALDARESISIVDLASSPREPDLLVVITNQAATCDSLVSDAVHNVQRAFRRGLTLHLHFLGRDLSPGTYPITPAPPPAHPDVLVGAFFGDGDAECHEHSATAKSGSIVVTSITPGTVSGTFDVSFPGGDRLTGSFEAPRCDRFATARPGPDASTCVH